MVAVLMVMMALAFLQVPPLVNRKQWGELAAFAGLWVVAGVYAFLVFGFHIRGAPIIPTLVDVLTPLLSRIYERLGLDWL